MPGTLRFGRRTLVLLHGGATWVVYGVLVWAVPVQRFSGYPVLGDFLSVLDLPEWGFMWVVGGACALTNAPFRRQWLGRDVLGFIGLLIPPAWWFIAYAWSALAVLIPEGESGNSRALAGVVLWYAISVIVLIVAGWPDPNDPATPHPRDDVLP